MRSNDIRVSEMKTSMDVIMIRMADLFCLLRLGLIETSQLQQFTVWMRYVGMIDIIYHDREDVKAAIKKMARLSVTVGKLREEHIKEAGERFWGEF